jgi:hypothetical protein
LESNYIQDLLEDLARAGVEFIVAGGVAVVLHGVSRATMDIDAAISFHPTNIRKFLDIMLKQNMKPRAPVPAEILLDSIERKKMIIEKGALVFTFIDNEKPYKQLDIFLTEDLSYEKLKSYCDIFEIGSSKIKVLSIKKLLELKKAINPARSKDLYDIAELSKIGD